MKYCYLRLGYFHRHFVFLPIHVADENISNYLIFGTNQWNANFVDNCKKWKMMLKIT